MNTEGRRELVKGSETSRRQETKKKMGDNTKVMGGSEYDKSILYMYMKIL